MSHGFHGKILTIDLTSGKIGENTLKEADVKKYTLGSGLAARILYDEAPPDAAPLSAENPILFLSGLLTGTIIPTACKMSVCAKSPLTGIWNEATVGGHWPAEFRAVGYDGILLTGKSPEPVYLLIADTVKILPADDIWGKDTYETGEILKVRHEKHLVAAIGPAGENLVNFAAICFDPPNSRFAARAGIGANMGSKNLKAIVVKGQGKRVTVANPEKLKSLLKEQIPKIKENAKALGEFGTSGGAPAVESFGDLPIKNYAVGAYPDVVKISGQAMREKIWVKHYACWACPIGCAKIVKGELAGFGKFEGHYPEYETLGMLGSNLLVDDLYLLAYANELTNRLGMDTITTGSVVAFAIECYEKGKINKSDTGGIELKWGDAKSIIELIKMTSAREKIGAALALGVKEAAEKIGKNTVEYISHSKGLDYPAHDPRGHVSMALSYATSVRGACHLEGLTYFLDRGVPAKDLGVTAPTNQFDENGKPKIVFDMQNFLSLFNPLGLCKFLFHARVGHTQIAEWVNAVCGWDWTPDDYMKTGERLFNLKRLYGTRLGISKKDDLLLTRANSYPKKEGKAKGVVANLPKMLDEYYALRGWDDEGIPTEKRLKELGL
ncbi:MAG: aldehyde ferredoxin oxidoreductase [Elusimicrobia bacterium HGW-Elusimicrobia-1]|jgi:aldehyde:ferredoxin oxidoreductase|nr:MAG: aldehyde ferredoxin oxidoreductase [Elusimicrobia bacterium HGW-Elusimicrobia-1]